MAKNIFQTWYSDRVAVWILGAVIVAALAFYFFSIDQTVRNVVERQQIQQEVATLRSSIGELEFAYIEKKNNIDLQTASRLGYKRTDSPNYITRPALGRSGDNQQL